MSQRTVILPELLVKAAVVLEDLSDAIHAETATGEEFESTVEVLEGMTEVLKPYCPAYVRPRVVDAQRADQ